MHALPHSAPPSLQQAPTDPRLPQRLLDTPGQVRVHLPWGPCPFSWVLGPKALCAAQSPFRRPVADLRLHGGLMATSCQGLCRARTQSLSLRQTPPTRTPEETPKHSPSQSLWGTWVLGAQGLHERSERLWWEPGLILNANAPLPPSCQGFPFTLGRGASAHSRSSAHHLLGFL